MKTVALHLKGEKYSLIYNIDAMFSLSEHFGGEWIKQISEKTKEGLQSLVQSAVIMSECGANVRSDMGFPRPSTLTEAVAVQVTPREYLDIYEAVCMAVNIGMEREIDNEDEEVDLVLQEMQKKTDKIK